MIAQFSSPFKEGNYIYFFKNSGLQNQSVLYRKDSQGVEEVFLDPNSFSEDGTISLSDISFSKDGSVAAYAISEGGSDWRKVFFLDTETKSLLSDSLINQPIEYEAINLVKKVSRQGLVIYFSVPNNTPVS